MLIRHHARPAAGRDPDLRRRRRSAPGLARWPAARPYRWRLGAAESGPTSAKATAGPPRARSGRGNCGGAPTAIPGRAPFCRFAPSGRKTPGAKIRPAATTISRCGWIASSDGDRLRRDDHLYDFIVEIDHNTRPRIAGRGSAVFLHLARENFAPTAGCVSMTKVAMLRLLARLDPKTKIVIE